MQDGAELLERAITYALGVLHEVDPAAMSSPSPCPEWDVRALVSHLNDSVAVLYEAAETVRSPSVETSFRHCRAR